MNSLEITKRNLERLGLSRREAEIYILLVAHHELRIQEIAKLSGIPHSSVYQYPKVI
jgi:sugar-specific transcriptional regulator TrmB